MRFLSVDEAKRMEKAKKIHQETGVLCKNCECFHEKTRELIGDPGYEMEYITGECPRKKFQFGDNYCMFFRFK